MRWILGLVTLLIVLLVVAFLALLGLSFRPDAGRVEASVDIDRPAPVVYPWVTEPEKLKQWVGWLAAVESEDPGPRQVGSRETWVMDDPDRKRRMRIAAEVTALEANRLVRVHVQVPGAFEGDSEYRLEELEGGRTRLHSLGQFRYTSPVFRFMEPLITPQAKKKLSGDFTRLKQLVETSNGGAG